jgi:hypothetical protein
MTDVSGVTSAVSPQEPIQTTDATTDVSQTLLPAGAGIDQLPQPVLDAILQSMAQQICSASQNSTERIKEILRNQEQNRR